jgi:RHS repeat-associated protein
VLDEDIGLYYYGARYYDPQLGRFIQPDSVIPDLFNPQSYNRYSYVLNNPLRYTDPNGRWAQEVADWWQAMVGAATGYMSASPSHWIWNGSVGTFNSLLGGVAEPLRLGTDAGRLLVDGGTAGQVAFTAVQEAGRAAAIVPVGAAIGKGMGTLVKSVTASVEREAVGEAASVAGGGAVKKLSTASEERATVDRIRNVAGQGFDYAVENPRVQGLNRMQLGKDAEVQATRWLRRWAERNDVDLGPGGLQFQVRGANSAPDVVFGPARQIFDFKLTPKAVRPAQTQNFRTDFPGYNIDYILGP